MENFPNHHSFENKDNQGNYASRINPNKTSDPNVKHNSFYTDIQKNLTTSECPQRFKFEDIQAILLLKKSEDLSDVDELLEMEISKLRKKKKKHQKLVQKEIELPDANIPIISGKKLVRFSDIVELNVVFYSASYSKTEKIYLPVKEVEDSDPQTNGQKIKYRRKRKLGV